MNNKEKELDKLEEALLGCIMMIDEKITKDDAIGILTNVGMHRINKSLIENRFKL